MRTLAHRLRFTEPFFGVPRSGAMDVSPIQVSAGHKARGTRGGGRLRIQN